ncbi:hypothetical protein PTI98_012442 [Pleurotus ostreatus]|nr:hypothetical protein PTI98_012442 [Pleurotus ostreatus]
MPATSCGRPQPKRILIVGGGPCGLVALRNLTERGQFDKVKLVERRNDVGGVWHLEDPDGGQNPSWASPAYPGMVGNVLPDFLYFSEHPFPKTDRPHQPFPTLSETQEYLKRFAKPYLDDGSIRLNTEVITVDELPNWSGWKVVMKDWNSGGVEVEEVWDAVVIAVGWFDNPVWPPLSGLENLQKQGLAIHGKSWNGPSGFGGKRVLVVGNANSANDIASQLVSVAQIPVFRSVRRSPFPGFVSLPDERIHNVTAVRECSAVVSSDGRKQVKVVLEDGNQIEGLDLVIFATGYKPYPSFVSVLDDSNLQPLVSQSVEPQRIPRVHRHILYAPNPTLAFVGAVMAFTPFTIADVSSTWLSLAWSGQILYPETTDGRLEFERQRLVKLGETAKFFLENEGTERVPDDAKNVCVNGQLTCFISYNVLSIEEEPYAQGLRDDITTVQPELGIVLPEWTKERFEQRNGMYQLKLEALRAARDKSITDEA